MAPTNLTPNFIKKRSFSLRSTLLALTTIGLLLSAGCKKDDDHEPANVIDKYTYISSQTKQELLKAQEATVRYKDIKNAVTDGYADIDVVVQNMGFHYMKASLADTVFDYTKPEILVYNKNEQNVIELVAVEYAVPIALRPDTAPEGFSGTNDVWKRDTGFGLWLLHAWVYAYNPDGVFNPTNSTVHVH